MRTKILVANEPPFLLSLGLRTTLPKVPSRMHSATPHHNTAHIEHAGHTVSQAASHLHKAEHDRDCARLGWERTEEIASHYTAHKRHRPKADHAEYRRRQLERMIT